MSKHVFVAIDHSGVDNNRESEILVVTTDLERARKACERRYGTWPIALKRTMRWTREIDGDVFDEVFYKLHGSTVYPGLEIQRWKMKR